MRLYGPDSTKVVINHICRYSVIGYYLFVYFNYVTCRITVRLLPLGVARCKSIQANAAFCAGTCVMLLTATFCGLILGSSF